MPLGPSRYPFQKPPWPFQLNRDCEQAQGLIAWWPGAPGQFSTTLYDHSGLANTGTLNGTGAATSWSASLDTGEAAIKTDGSAIYGSATVPQLSGLGAASIGCWVFRSSTGIKNAFGFGSVSSTARFNCLWFTDNIIYGSGPGGTLAYYNTAAITKTGWHRLDVNYLGTAAMEIYLDGIKQTNTGSGGASPAPSITNPGNTTFWFGREISNGFCVGTYESAVAYSRYRTASEMWGCFDPYTRWQLRWRPSNRTVSAPAAAFNRRRRIFA